MKTIKGYFMEPQNFSVNDGSGIRTILFFAGCPLRCQWCSNPEGYSNAQKLAYYQGSCIQCGSCMQVCPENVGINLNSTENRSRCLSCGLCAKACTTGSRRELVHLFSSRELLERLEKQRIFYRYSGGGVTFSGGEATMQSGILRELVYELYDKAIDMALETSGYFLFDDIKDILEKLNLIFIDIKHMDDNLHRFYTGIGNKEILSNLSRLRELKVPVVARIPLIEGVNADAENIRSTARFLKSNMALPKLELLPYHMYGDEKYEALGMEKPSRDFKVPAAEKMKELYKVVESEGVEWVSYK